MQRFDLDLLNALVIVADSGSFTAAATKICRSQSAVSEQVRKLEAFCGQPLFTRGKMGVRLTPAGERLLPQAREILAFNDAIYRDVQGNDLTGTLRLAITDYFRPDSIATVLRRLRRSYPRLKLHVDIRPSASIDKDVHDGDCDIGLAMYPVQQDETLPDGCRELDREPLHWVAAEKTLAMSTPVPLVMMPENCALHRLATQRLRDEGMPYEVAHSASGVAGLQLALAAGLGIGCLNASAVSDNLVRLEPELPGLPMVAFALIPTLRPTPFVREACEMLIDELRRT